MKRREFLAAFVGIVARPLAAHAQQPRQVIGFLHQGSLPQPSWIAAFRKGLVEAGFGDGLTIPIEDRAADGEYDRLPALAAELVDGQVSVIAADFLPAALAAKAATKIIPIVFLTGSDPIGAGLVASVNRPTDNVTGVAFIFTRLGAKNLELLRELVPNATSIAALINPTNPNSEPQLKDLQAAASTLGVNVEAVRASSEQELEGVFASLPQRRIGAVLITADGFLISRRDRLVAL